MENTGCSLQFVIMCFDDGLQNESTSVTTMNDIGRRGVRLGITMKQNVAKLRCESAVDKAVVLLNLSRMRLENATLSLAHNGLVKKHVRNVLNGGPRKLQHANAPINSVWQLIAVDGGNNPISCGRDVRVNVGMARNLALPHAPATFLPDMLLVGVIQCPITRGVYGRNTETGRPLLLLTLL